MAHQQSEVLFIGGRSGVGKTSVASELHERLSAQGVKHDVIEGDSLDPAHPPPWAHGLAEKNLAAMWANYRALGYRRLIYANTVSVLRETPSWVWRIATDGKDVPAVAGEILERLSWP